MGFGVKSITNLQKEGKKQGTYKKEVKIEERKDIEMLQITQEELINLLIKYNIPVVRDTIITIKQHPIFYVEK